MGRSTETCRIAILGGGFAGSLTGMLAARIGYDTIVLEREKHPRFAIGESLTPLANQILRRLGAAYDLPELIALGRAGTWRTRYPHVTGGIKRGFSYFHHRPGRPFSSDAEHSSELLVAASRCDERADTQWLRSDVDAWFAERARETSVRIVERVEVESVERNGGTWQIGCRDRDTGAEWTIVSDGIVQAAGGRTTPLDRFVENRSTDAGFGTATRAIWTHVEGLPRFEEHLLQRGIDISRYPFRCDDAALHHVVEEGWIWQIRFWNGRTSIGLVTPVDQVPAETSPAEEFARVVSRYPSLAETFRTMRLSSCPGAWHGAPRLQRRRRFAALPGAVWLPFAYGFVDPLHSTGIAASLWGIEHVASHLASAWRTRSSGGQIFGASWAADYDVAMRGALDLTDGLIQAAYTGMHDADLFHAATMLYFAAATMAERAERDDSLDNASGFLGSEVAAFREVVETALSILRNVPRPAPTGAVGEASGAIEKLLQPFDRVGLFRPPEPRMYWETAAPES